MTLTEFLDKWAKGDRQRERQIKGMLSGLFECDPRTIYNWVNKATPRYAQFTLKVLDHHWNEQGRITYSELLE